MFLNIRRDFGIFFDAPSLIVFLLPFFLCVALCVALWVALVLKTVPIAGEGGGLNFAVAAANLPACAEAIEAGSGRFNCVSYALAPARG